MISDLVRDARSAFAEQAGFDRFMTGFWLLGPFFMLIERSPADLWLSILALCFVGRSVARRDASWLTPFWVRAAFGFWGLCLMSALLSEAPGYSFGEAFGWVRFPLFAMATAFWLGKDRRLLNAMLLSTAVGVAVMCGILAAEVMIEGQRGGRLSWPYDDLVPGSYLAKAGLPVVVILAAVTAAGARRSAFLAALGVLLVGGMTLMTGERVNFLIVLCSAFLAGLVWKPDWKRYLVLTLSAAAVLAATLYAAPHLGNRFVNATIADLPTGDHSPYYRATMPGLMAFASAPVFGIGPGNFEAMCPDIVAEASNLDCHPHPHHFYAQMLGETGILGAVAGTLFLWSMIVWCFRTGWRQRQDLVLATAWVVPFAFFWPVAANADFFGQWNNIFMWSALALAMAAVQSRFNDQ